MGLFERSGLASSKGDYESADNVVEQAKEAEGHAGDLLNLSRRRRRASQTRFSAHSRGHQGTAEYAADIAEVVINMNTESRCPGTKRADLRAKLAVLPEESRSVTGESHGSRTCSDSKSASLHSAVQTARPARKKKCLSWPL